MRPCSIVSSIFFTSGADAQAQGGRLRDDVAGVALHAGHLDAVDDALDDVQARDLRRAGEPAPRCFELGTHRRDILRCGGGTQAGLDLRLDVREATQLALDEGLLLLGDG